MAQETVVVSNEVYANQVKLFGKWNCDEVNVEDISLRVIFFLFIFYFFVQTRLLFIQSCIRWFKAAVIKK